MEYDIRLEQHLGTSLAVVRRLAAASELAKVVPAACGTVWNAMRERQISGAGRHVAVYLDGQINLEVGVELEAPFASQGEVVGSSTPAGPVATTTHYGPYHLLSTAHTAIAKWCTTHGRTSTGVTWEIYGHWLDEWNQDRTKIRTDVYHLLKPVDCAP